MKNSLSLSEFRSKHGITQVQLAEMLEITPEYVSMIENGKKTASQKILNKLGCFDGSKVTVRSNIRDMVMRGIGATGKNAHELADLMGRPAAEVQAALEGKDQSQAFTDAFDKKVQPIIEARKTNTCPDCAKHVTEINRLNKIIDKLILK